jgi:succinyl-diaminopimelate desuccinylase
MDSTIALAQKLIQQPSVTPDDHGCQTILWERLKPLGFTRSDHSSHDVTNSYFELNRGGPMLWLVGHSDVVPTGPESQWTYPPFLGHTDDTWLHGRGSADMKGSLAAMIVAIEQYLAQPPNGRGSLALLVTSDEEGPAQHGIKHMIEKLKINPPQWCLVGEPSSSQQLGDTIKIGRRGSLTAEITFHGKQGHIAYPHLANNPIHGCLTALSALCQNHWDQGNDHFPPTSFQIANIQAGTGASNVIPGTLTAQANFRFSTENTADSLREKTQAILDNHTLDYTIDWHHSGNPFLTTQTTLVNAMQDAIHEHLGMRAELSTSGGTSDGRFIAPLGCELIEFGPINQTIHQIDERVSIQDLIKLTDIYRMLMLKLFN